MSAELLHVIAAILLRLTRRDGAVPLTRRYDPYERVWSAPMPFLFQRDAFGYGVIGAATARIRDLQRIHDSLADLVATCDLPRADRSCALLDAIDHRPEATR